MSGAACCSLHGCRNCALQRDQAGRGPACSAPNPACLEGQQRGRVCGASQTYPSVLFHPCPSPTHGLLPTATACRKAGERHVSGIFWILYKVFIVMLV